MPLLAEKPITTPAPTELISRQLSAIARGLAFRRRFPTIAAFSPATFAGVTVERFARVVIGYHGCTKAFAHRMLLGETAIDDWRPSENEWDWLGHGIYFWEHSPARALRWAEAKYGRKGRPAIVGAVIQLGTCFDLLNESITRVLAENYQKLAKSFSDEGRSLPRNRGHESKMRVLDCLVVNDCLRRLGDQRRVYDTVRGAFWEGEPIYPGAAFARESHIQVVVRNPACILGIFRPNLTV